MKEIEIQILKIISNLTLSDQNLYASVASIDRRVLLIDSNIIYSGKLVGILNNLVDNEFLSWNNENKSALKITDIGLKTLDD